MADKEFKVKFTADDAKLVAAINALTKGGAKITQTMNSADTDSKKAIRSITQEINRIQRSFNSLTPPTQIGPSFSKLATSMGVGTLGATAFTKAVSALSSAFSAAMGKIGLWTDMADAIGLSIPKIQVLEATATKAGVSFDKVVTTMYRLQKATQEAREGSTAQAEAFNKLNLSAEKLSSLDIEEQFVTVVERLSTMKDATERNALAMELLGKSWAEISKMAPNLRSHLEETDAQLEKMGIKLSSLDDENLRKLDDTLDMFNQTLSNGTLKAIAVVTPGLLEFISTWSEGIAGITRDWVNFQEALERSKSVGERAGVVSGNYGNTPTANSAYIQRRLGEAGFTGRQARGITESLYDESRLDPTAVNKESSAVGIAQWLGPRQEALKEFAAKLGKSFLNLEVQVMFLIHELETTEQETAKRIKEIKSSDAGEYSDIKKARDVFTNGFERPGEKQSQKRSAAPLKALPPTNNPDVSGKNDSDRAKTERDKLAAEAKKRAELLDAITLQADQEERLLQIQKQQGEVAAQLERTRYQAIEAAKKAGFTEGSADFNNFVTQSTRLAAASKSIKDLDTASETAAKREKVTATIASEIAAQQELLAAALRGGTEEYEKAAEKMKSATEAAKISRETGIPISDIQQKLEQKARLDSQVTTAKNVADGRTALYQESKDLKSLAQALSSSSAEYERQIRLLKLTAQVREEMKGSTPDEIQAEVARRQGTVEQNANLERQNELALTEQQNNRPFSEMANEALAGSTDITTTAGQFQALQDAIGGASDALTNFIFTGQGNFQAFALQFIQQLTAMIVKAIMFRAIMAAIGMPTAPVPAAAADGGAFTATGAQVGGSADLAAKGKVYGFKNGEHFTNNLYTSPTMFRFGKGGANLGIMGEAGPEAVMPLARDSQGRLGVRSGSQGPTNNFSVVINPHPQQSSGDAERLGRQAADALKAEMVRTFTEQQKRGSRHGPGRSITA